MTPIIAVALVGGAAGAVYLYSKRLKGQVPGALPGVVGILSKGKSYAVLLTITAQDGRGGQKPIGTTDPVKASSVIRSTYEQLGFKFLSQPVLRNPSETSDFLHNNSSQWIFNAQWTLDTPAPAIEPPWMLSHDFVLLPIT